MRGWLVALLLGLVGVSSASDQFGPLEVRNNRALSLPFFRFEPRPSVLRAGEAQWSFGFSLANDLKKEKMGAKQLYEDQETLRLLPRYRRGLGQGLDLTVDLPVYSRSGGVLDWIITWWHHYVTGTYGKLRDSIPNGLSNITVPGAPPFGSATGIGDLSATLTKDFGKGLTASLGLKLPTGRADALFGSGAADLGLSFQYTREIVRGFSGFAQFAGVLQGRATRLPNSRPTVGQFSFGLMWQRNSRDRWIIQTQAEDSASRTGLPDSDKRHGIASIGFQRKLSSRQTLELFFSEDHDGYNKLLTGVGPDLTIGLRLMTRF